MLIRRFIRPSERQMEQAGGDKIAAQKHTLDWHYIRGGVASYGSRKRIRIALGRFEECEGDGWWHTSSAQVRNLHDTMPLNGAEVAGSVTRSVLRELSHADGVRLLSLLSRKLLTATMAADPRRLPHDEETALRLIAAERQYAPRGSLAIIDLEPDGKDVDVIMTQVGNTHVALDTAGRTLQVTEGTLWQQPLNGEIILGNKKDADKLKIDAVGDLPAEGVAYIRFRLTNVLAAPHPRIILWTRGSAPDRAEGIALEHLQKVSTGSERTELEITIDNAMSSRTKIVENKNVVETGYRVDIVNVDKE